LVRSRHLAKHLLDKVPTSDVMIGGLHAQVEAVQRHARGLFSRQVAKRQRNQGVAIGAFHGGDVRFEPFQEDILRQLLKERSPLVQWAGHDELAHALPKVVMSVEFIG
jgi:hypothetical protein